MQLYLQLLLQEFDPRFWKDALYNDEVLGIKYLKVGTGRVKKARERKAWEGWGRVGKSKEE